MTLDQRIVLPDDQYDYDACEEYGGDRSRRSQRRKADGGMDAGGRDEGSALVRAGRSDLTGTLPKRGKDFGAPKTLGPSG